MKKSHRAFFAALTLLSTICSTPCPILYLKTHHDLKCEQRSENWGEGLAGKDFLILCKTIFDNYLSERKLPFEKNWPSDLLFIFFLLLALLLTFTPLSYFRGIEL